MITEARPYPWVPKLDKNYRDYDMRYVDMQSDIFEWTMEGAMGVEDSKRYSDALYLYWTQQYEMDKAQYYWASVRSIRIFLLFVILTNLVQLLYSVHLFMWWLRWGW